MGLPSRSAVRAADLTVAGLELRFRALLGDGWVFVSRSGSDLPLAGAVGRIDTSTHLPCLAILDPGIVPGLLEAAEPVQASAVAYYRQHRPVPLSAFRVRPEPYTSGSKSWLRQ